MPLKPSAVTKNAFEVACGDPSVAAEILAGIPGGGSTSITGLTSVTASATTGSLPTPTGAILIANTATPTVVELLKYCTELNDKLTKLLAT